MNPGRVAEWYTRATQNRVPYGLRVQVPPCPPKYELPIREFLFWLQRSQLTAWLARDLNGKVGLFDRLFLVKF